MGKLGSWLDRTVESKRQREIDEEPRLEWRPDARERLDEAGFQAYWRLHRGKAHGSKLSGEPVTLDADEFIDTFMVRR